MATGCPVWEGISVEAVRQPQGADLPGGEAEPCPPAPGEGHGSWGQHLRKQGVGRDTCQGHEGEAGMRAKVEVMVKVRSGGGSRSGRVRVREVVSAGVSVSDPVGSSSIWGTGVGLVTLGQAGSKWEPVREPGALVRGLPLSSSSGSTETWDAGTPPAPEDPPGLGGCTCLTDPLLP